MSSLTLLERKKGDVLILDLEGNIRLGEEGTVFRSALRLLTAGGEKKIILNMAKVSYMDSSGLGDLVAGYSNLKKNGGELKILNLTRRINELLIITKLLTVFDIYDNEADAIESFTGISVKSAYTSSLLL
jgi:anti-sigma B factor antagonist